MKTHDSRRVLAGNLDQLMTHHWGGRNLNRLAKEVLKSSNAQAKRVMEGDTNTGVQTADLAAAHWHLDPWQLLVPGFAVQRPPALLEGPAQAAVRFSEELLAKIAELDGAAMARLENLMRAHLDLRTVDPSFQNPTDAQTPAQKSSRGQPGHRGKRAA
jgi:hypothetical protein